MHKHTLTTAEISEALRVHAANSHRRSSSGFILTNLLPQQETPEAIKLRYEGPADSESLVIPGDHLGQLQAAVKARGGYFTNLGGFDLIGLPS